MGKHNIKVDAIGLAAEVVELRNEIARLKNQTNWVCQCGGTDCEGQKENADLRNTLDAVIWADERGVELWRAAHPGKELVIPDRAKLVEWLLEQNAALREDYVEMGKTAFKSEINHYIGSIIMTDDQKKLREAVKQELPERASWAEIYAVYEIVRDRTKEAQP